MWTKLRILCFFLWAETLQIRRPVYISGLYACKNGKMQQRWLLDGKEPWKEPNFVSDSSLDAHVNETHLEHEPFLFEMHFKS